jgi:protein SCO1/2
MKRLIAIVLLLYMLPAPAAFGFSATDLNAISAAPGPGAALPSGLHFLDQQGRSLKLAAALHGVPNVLIFADYKCRTLCGPIVEFAASALAKTGLRPGADYRVIVIGLDPRDGLADARAMEAEHVGAASPIERAALFLTGDRAAITAATAALGYHYRYDPQHDQFAHPAAVYITDARGRVTRVLSGLGLDGVDLRLALVDAGHGAVGTLIDQIHLLCYGYDPVRGVYTERITFILELAAGATLLVMAGGILTLLAFERRRASS